MTMPLQLFHSSALGGSRYGVTGRRNIGLDTSRAVVLQIRVAPIKRIRRSGDLGITPSPSPRAVQNQQPIFPLQRTMASNAPKRPQSSGSPDYTPNKSKSLPLSPQRQALLDDILALYSCHPTVERIKRYTPDAVYDDDFGYADNRYKIAGQWFSLPKLFSDSENIGYEVVTNDADLIQFKSSQKWTFRLIQKATTLKSLVSLSLEQSSQGADFICVKHHKDQTNDKEEDHKSLGFSFKKWQADNMPKVLNVEELQAFEGDKNAGKAKASI